MIRVQIDRMRFEKSQREGRKLTYEVMSEETGLSINSVAQLVKGQIVRVELRTLDLLCDYFNCTVGDILEYVPNQTSE